MKSVVLLRDIRDVDLNTYKDGEPVPLGEHRVTLCDLQDGEPVLHTTKEGFKTLCFVCPPNLTAQEIFDVPVWVGWLPLTHSQAMMLAGIHYEFPLSRLDVRVQYNGPDSWTFAPCRTHLPSLIPAKSLRALERRALALLAEKLRECDCAPGGCGCD